MALGSLAKLGKAAAGALIPAPLVYNYLQNRKAEAKADRPVVTQDPEEAQEIYDDYEPRPTSPGNTAIDSQITDWYGGVEKDLQENSKSKGEHYTRDNEDALINAARRDYETLPLDRKQGVPTPHWDRKDDQILVNTMSGPLNRGAAGTYYRPIDNSDKRRQYREMDEHSRSMWERRINANTNQAYKQHPPALSFLDKVLPDGGWKNPKYSPLKGDTPPEIQIRKDSRDQEGLLPHELAHHITHKGEDLVPANDPRPGRSRPQGQDTYWMDDALAAKAAYSPLTPHAAKSNEIFADFAAAKRRYFHDFMPRMDEEYAKIYEEEGPEAYNKRLQENPEDLRSLHEYRKFKEQGSLKELNKFLNKPEWSPSDYQIDDMINRYIGTNKGRARGDEWDRGVLQQGADATGIRRVLSGGTEENPYGDPDDDVPPVERLKQEHPESLKKLRELMRISKTDNPQAGMFTGKGMLA